MRPFLPALTAAAATAAVALAPAASDSSARVRESLTLDRACYVVGKHNTIHVTGKNFTPNAPLHVYSGDAPGADTADFGVPIDADGTTAPDGTFSLDVPVPALEKGDKLTLDLAAVARTSSADETVGFDKLNLTSFTAGFYSFEGRDYFMVVDKNSTGSQGKSASGKRYRVKSKVNFFGFGFNDGKFAPPAFLFIHYVDPSGKSVGDIYEATARGCGAARTLSGHPLFDRVKPRPGLWKLQFDWNKKYKKNAADKKVLYVKVDKKGFATFPNNYVRDLGD
ncbi:MAG: hypothetical protein ACJ76V_07220 [Thermoleophilaceae bacterium]